MNPLLNKRLRQIAKERIPAWIVYDGWKWYCRFRARRARRAFEQAGTTPEWAERAVLEQLQAQFPPEPITYHYDPASLHRRGQERAESLLQLLAHEPELRLFLDLGAWDNMVCYALQQRGKHAIGTDLVADGIAGAARQAGVPFAQMDSGALGFADSSVDVVFSYNCFEHFPEPEAVVREALRVLRPGGYFYANFGPLYFSPKGAHQWKSINVPYCQCLFPKALLSDFAAAHQLELTGFHWMNEWSLGQFHRLWEAYSDRLVPVVYHETYNADHVSLIEQFPSLFKSKTEQFEDLIVAYIEGLWRKVG